MFPDAAEEMAKLKKKDEEDVDLLLLLVMTMNFHLIHKVGEGLKPSSLLSKIKGGIDYDKRIRKELYTQLHLMGHIRRGGVFRMDKLWVDFWFSEGGKIFWGRGDTKFWTVRRLPPLTGKLVVTNG